MWKCLRRAGTSALVIGVAATCASPAATRPLDAPWPTVRTGERTLLQGRAVLPAATFREGSEPSGRDVVSTFYPKTNPTDPAFAAQPVQGLSAIVDAGDGSIWAMSDNGYGAKDNSEDFLLGVHRLRPDFRTADDGTGTVAYEGFLGLADPDHEIPFPIVRDAGDRALTGGDLDIESMRAAPDGTLWFGDEFGPFLLHTDADGTVLEAPIPLPDFDAAAPRPTLKSPQNPDLAAGETPRVPRSGGFEGMAISPNGKRLYPMLELGLAGDTDARRRWIFEFDLRHERYTGRRWSYRVDAAGYSIGDLTAIDANRLIVIERDNAQGVDARQKRLFVIDLRRTNRVGALVKRDLADLLRIDDPDGISEGTARPGDVGLGDPFAFPFQTIESVLPLDGRHVLVANDNNFPFSIGRNPGLPDDNELIVLQTTRLSR